MVTRTHLVEDDPGWLPGQLVGGLHHGFPCPPKEVSVGNIEERHSQVAFKLRQHVQDSLGDTRKGVLRATPEPLWGPSGGLRAYPIFSYRKLSFLLATTSLHSTWSWWSYTP